MEIEAVIVQRRELQTLVLDFIENDNDEDSFQSLTKYIENNNTCKNKIDVDDLLHIILMISNNHHRKSNFLAKILQIIKYLLPYIQEFYSNLDIYRIFQNNRLLTLYLIQNQIFLLDQDIFNEICTFNYNSNPFTFSFQKFSQPNPYSMYFQYLYYEFMHFEDKKEDIKSKIMENFKMDFDSFQNLCQEGENESYICKLIRKDQLNEFISYVNETNCELNSETPDSLFESNFFLLKEKAKLIEYAAFFGSIQIFKYLQMNKVRQEQHLMDFAVHGRNSEIIHLVEEAAKTEPNNNNNNNFFNQRNFFMPSRSNVYSPMRPYIESIFCHHNEIASYFEQNELDGNIDYFGSQSQEIPQSYNYEMLPTDMNSLLSMRRNRSFNNLTKHDIYQKFLQLEKITIPDTETKILPSLFSNFKLLKEIIIPSSVVLIESFAFQECSSLEHIEIPSSVQSIKNNAFSRCSSLIQITIPSSVKLIERNCFEYCKSLVQVDIKAEINLIDSYLFKECTSLKEVSIPSSVTKINAYAFSMCPSLTKIELPSSLVLIGSGAFNGCSSLKCLALPSSVKTIGCDESEIMYYNQDSSICGVFNRCSSLVEISIPDDVLRIEDYTFNGCTSLEKVSFDKSSLSSIGKCAFKGCKSLHEINIPSIVKFIGESCFEGCSSKIVIRLHKSKFLLL